MHINMIRFSPHNDIILLGGFGSLVGDMQFWDRESLELIGSAKAHCAVATEWAPNSREFIAAVMHPRVRVDNEITVFNNYGKKIYYQRLAEGEELYQCLWQPFSPDIYPQWSVPMLDVAYEAEPEVKKKAAF
jgi:uncharacterized protein with WD repeat